METCSSCKYYGVVCAVEPDSTIAQECDDYRNSVTGKRKKDWFPERRTGYGSGDRELEE